MKFFLELVMNGRCLWENIIYSMRIIMRRMMMKWICECVTIIYYNDLSFVQRSVTIAFSFTNCTLREVAIWMWHELKIDASNQLLNDANKHMCLCVRRRVSEKDASFFTEIFKSGQIHIDSFKRNLWICVRTSRKLVNERNERKWIFLAENKRKKRSLIINEAQC